MKTCPICHSGAFDDAAICYGCLHPFAEGEGAVAPVQVDDNEGQAAAISIPIGGVATSPGGVPALIISVQAVQGAQGGVEWRCDMDGRAAPDAQPAFAVPVAAAL